MDTQPLDILMATRNGSLYVEEQIRSLFAQTFREWRLIIHDDGSEDGTIDILKRLAKEDSRIIILEDNFVSGSAPANFMYLLGHSDAPRVMFCDQDDVWFPDKVAKMMARADRLPEEIPGVVYSRSYYWNEKKGILGETWRRYPDGLAQFLGQKAAVQGSAALFNGAMRNEMVRYQGPMVMHDHLLGLIAHSFGHIEYMPDLLMNYRQHSHNVTGNNDEIKKGFDWLKAKFVDPKPVMDSLTIESVKGFSAFFSDRIPEDRKDLIKIYLGLDKKSRIGRAWATFRYGFARDGSVPKLVAKMLLTPYL